MNKKELHMMIGGIGTGKSTYSQELAENKKYKIFGGDELEEQYNKERKNDESLQEYTLDEFIDAELKKQFKSGDNFILDGKCLSKKGRKFVIDIAKEEGYTIYGYDFGPGNVMSLIHRLRNPRRFIKAFWESIHENDKLTYATPEIEEGFKIIYIPKKS